MPKRTSGDRAELKPVKVGAAAIDIGSKMHMAALEAKLGLVAAQPLPKLTLY